MEVLVVTDWPGSMKGLLNRSGPLVDAPPASRKVILGVAPPLGEALEEGLRLGEGERDEDGEGVGEVDDEGLMLLLGLREGETLELGETDADGLTEADGLTLGLGLRLGDPAGNSIPVPEL